MNKDLTQRTRVKIPMQVLGNALKSQTELKLLYIFILHYFTMLFTQEILSSALSRILQFLFCFPGHLLCKCIFEMELSNDQWVQEQRDHSYHHRSIIGYMCMGQTALANVSRMCDPGRSSVNRRKHLQQFCLKSQINYITNRNELKRDLGTMCFLFTCLKYLGEKIKYLIIIF